MKQIIIAMALAAMTTTACAAPVPSFDKMDWQTMVDTAEKAFQDNFNPDNVQPAVTACAKVVRASGLASNGVPRTQHIDDYPNFTLSIILNGADGYTGCSVTNK